MLQQPSVFPSITPSVVFLLTHTPLPDGRDRIALLYHIPRGTILIDIVSPLKEWRIANHSELLLFLHHPTLQGFVYREDAVPSATKHYTIIGGILYDVTRARLEYHSDDNGTYVSWQRIPGYERNDGFVDTKEEDEFMFVRAQKETYLLLVKTV
jgi:hypothetical protein